MSRSFGTKNAAQHQATWDCVEIQGERGFRIIATVQQHCPEELRDADHSDRQR